MQPSTAADGGRAWGTIAPVVTTARCPQCLQPMQSLRMREVELDRCGRCGGLWFDAGELEQVTARPVQLAPSPELTNHLCARCDIALSVVQLGPLEVESCGGCRGLFLGRGVLHQFAPDAPGLNPRPPPPGMVKAVPRAPRPQPPPTSTSAPASRPRPKPSPTPNASSDASPKASSGEGFDCVVCGKRTPFARGNAHPRGLVCSDCVVPVQHDRPVEHGPWMSHTDPLTHSADLLGLIVDGLLSILLR